MIDAPAGTGKTFTEKVIAASLRGDGKTVLAVASTGTAALQLPVAGPRTQCSIFPLTKTLSLELCATSEARLQEPSSLKNAVSYFL